MRFLIVLFVALGLVLAYLAYQNPGTVTVYLSQDQTFEVSIIDLRPMLILAIPLRRRARKAIPMKPYLFERPVL